MHEVLHCMTVFMVILRLFLSDFYPFVYRVDKKRNPNLMLNNSTKQTSTSPFWDQFLD